VSVDSLDEIKRFFGFTREPVFVHEENEYQKVENVLDFDGRRRKDALVLSTFAANASVGKMLEIGTYYGHGAASMAANSPQSTIYTVNALPEQVHKSGGKYPTEFLSKDEIGKFYREKGLKNIQQIYADTKSWKVEQEINELSLVFIDGCHDQSFVYNDSKLVIDRVASGGFILWHDFSVAKRGNFPWINDCMLAVEALIREKKISGYVLNLRGSWIGIWRKG
jgi:predicted O-methyltransferase YrrM